MAAIGSDAAMEAADIALMGDDLAHVRESILLGRRTMAIIRQNMAIALGLKLLFVAAVLAGWATLWMAVVADTGASVLVTLNAMRLMRDENDTLLDPAPDGAGSDH
jgi:Cd2+/Zn2+-exporting ATPase